MISCQRHHLEARCRERGYTIDDVRACIIFEDGDEITVDETHEAYPKKRNNSPPPKMERTAEGAGTELKALLKDWLGIESSPTCSCNRMANKMNSQPIEWSESDEGMAEILGVMRAEHGKRREAGKTLLPWTDAGARQLVLLACRRAKAHKSPVDGL